MARAEQVGTGARLGHGNRADHFAGDQFGQVLLLLLRRAVIEDIWRDDVRVQPPANAGQAGAGDFLDDNGTVAEIRPHTAILFRHGRTQEAQLTGLLPKFTADLAVLLPLIVIRRSLLLQELAHGVAEAFQVGIEKGTWNHGEPR